MKLLWPIVKKDTLQLRGMLVLWTLLLVLLLAVGEALFISGQNGDTWFDRQIWWVFLPAFAIPLIAYLAMGILLLEDEVVGTAMFWVTRPISGFRLLLSKAVTCFLWFGLWPTLLCGLAWLRYGYGPMEIVSAAAIMIAIHGVLFLAALAMASLTGTLPRFLLWSLVGAIGTVVSFLALQWTFSYGLPKEMAEARFKVFAALSLVATLLVIGIQYGSRRTLLARSVAIGGWVIAFGVAAVWPWKLELESKPTVVTFAEQVEIDVRDFLIMRTQAASGQILIALLNLKKIPSDHDLMRGELQVSLRWPDGRSEALILREDFSRYSRMAEAALNLGARNPDPESEVERKSRWNRLVEKRAQEGQLPGEVVSGVHWKASIPISSELFEKIEAARPHITAVVKFDFARPRLLVEMPMQVGPAVTGDGIRMRVAKIARKKNSSGRTIELLYGIPQENSNWELYLLERRRGSAEIATASNGAIPFIGSAFGVHYLPLIGRRYFTVGLPHVFRNSSWIVDDNAELTLAAVAFPDAGSLTREIAILNIEVKSGRVEPEVHSSNPAVRLK